MADGLLQARERTRDGFDVEAGHASIRPPEARWWGAAAREIVKFGGAPARGAR